MKKQIELSVIIPVFNEEKYLSIALESVLWQRVDFPFEIIIVDDVSTDTTYDIAQSYVERFPNIITLLRNEENMGEGRSFMRAYEAARGKYFHVLDGDDYFLNFNKLQVQKDFLDKNDDFFAVCHNSFRLFPDGKIRLESLHKTEMTFDYEDCIKRMFYAHTSTFMFRKIGKKMPDYFKKPAMSGDDPRFIYHAFKTKGKVKYLPMIGSVYNFHGQGIWSTLSLAEQAQLQSDFLDIVLNDMIGEPRHLEYELIEQQRDRVRKNTSKPRVDIHQRNTCDHILTYCQKVASIVYHAPQREICFSAMHSVPIVDSLCESVGGILRNRLDLRFGQRQFNDKTVAIMIPGLVINGGGVAKEIRELVSLYVEARFDVHILSTNSIETPVKEIESYLNVGGKISFWHMPDIHSMSDRVALLQEKLYEIAAGRLYPFIGHHDVVQGAALQRGLAKEVIIDYVYDHGTSLGIHHSAIDFVIAKTPSQAAALAEKLGKSRVLFIPPLLKDKYGANSYQPPVASSPINTACAAARSYKLESDYRYHYADVICHILKITGGTHYHYGPLSQDFFKLLAKKMAQTQLSAERFVHIEWADDLSADLLAKAVHLFIAPFPVCSARITLEVMLAGIPILNHASSNAQLPQSDDFTGKDQPIWHNYFDLHNILISLDPKKLANLSKKARLYYEIHNKFETCSQRFFNKQGFPYPDEPQANIQLRNIEDVDYYKYDETLYKFNQKVTIAPIKSSKKINQLAYWRRKSYLFYKKRLYLIALILTSFLYLFPGVHDYLNKKNMLQKVIKKINKYI